MKKVLVLTCIMSARVEQCEHALQEASERIIALETALEAQIATVQELTAAALQRQELETLFTEDQPLHQKITALVADAVAQAMAFQMVDDALDFAPESVTGKPTGGDVREGKLTPPLRRYRDGLGEAERAAFDAAFCAGMMTEADAADIAGRIRQQGHDEAVRRQAEEFLDVARRALENLPDRPERELMRQMADYVRDRKK